VRESGRMGLQSLEHDTEIYQFPPWKTVVGGTLLWAGLSTSFQGVFHGNLPRRVKGHGGKRFSLPSSDPKRKKKKKSAGPRQPDQGRSVCVVCVSRRDGLGGEECRPGKEKRVPWSHKGWWADYGSVTFHSEEKETDGVNGKGKGQSKQLGRKKDIGGERAESTKLSSKGGGS